MAGLCCQPFAATRSIAVRFILHLRIVPMPRQMTQVARLRARTQSAVGGVVVTRPVDVTGTAPFRILALASRFTSQFASVYTGRFGLGLPQWRTLALLGVHGSMPAARIAEVAVVDRGLVSRAVAELETAGLVARVDHPTDGRTRLVALTARGADLHDRVAQLHLRRQERLFADFTAKERALLLDFLARLDTALDELILDPAFTDDLGRAVGRAGQRRRIPRRAEWREATSGPKKT